MVTLNKFEGTVIFQLLQVFAQRASAVMILNICKVKYIAHHLALLEQAHNAKVNYICIQAG